MSFTKDEKNLIGHWQSGSRMCDRYDRSTCAQELLIRNTILQNIVSGWAPVGPFVIPQPTLLGRDCTPLLGSGSSVSVSGVNEPLREGADKSEFDNCVKESKLDTCLSPSEPSLTGGAPLTPSIFPSPSDSTQRVEPPVVESSLPVCPNLG